MPKQGYGRKKGSKKSIRAATMRTAASGKGSRKPQSKAIRSNRNFGRGR